MKPSCYLLPLLFPFAFLLMSGCTESFTGSERTNQIDGVSREVPSKLRNQEAALPGAAAKGGNKGSSSSNAQVVDAYVVGVADGVDAFAILERYSLLYGVTPSRLFKRALNGFTVRTASMTDAQRAAWTADMDSNRDVLWFEPEPKMTMSSGGSRLLNEDKQRVPNRTREVGGDNSSAKSGDGQGQVDVDVYIIDSGVNHPDLNVVERIDFADMAGSVTASAVLERYALLERYAVLERYEYETGEAYDGIGHGTHVAGTIGAIDDQDDLVGVAPGAPIHDFRVLTSDGHGDFGAVIEAMEIIISRKQAHPELPIVVNLSLGANVGTSAYNGLDQIVDTAVKQGIVVVAAAGNDAVDVSLVSPAHVAGVITVGGADLARGKWVVSATSNLGKGIDIWAPAEKVDSLDPFDFRSSNILTGTSMAAPHVSGAVALILAKDPSASPHAVDIILKQDSHYKLWKGPNGMTDLVVDLGRL